MRSDNIIKQTGFNALAEKLDIVEVERFFMLIKREKFDYSKGRKNLFEDIRVEKYRMKQWNIFRIQRRNNY